MQGTFVICTLYPELRALCPEPFALMTLFYFKCLFYFIDIIEFLPCKKFYFFLVNFFPVSVTSVLLLPGTS